MESAPYDILFVGLIFRKKQAAKSRDRAAKDIPATASRRDKQTYRLRSRVREWVSRNATMARRSDRTETFFPLRS